MPLTEQLRKSIELYIEKYYVNPILNESRHAAVQTRSLCRNVQRSDAECYAPPCAAPNAASKAASLEELLQHTDAGFTETLLKLIDQTGKKDAQIYKRANISKQHFSKIRNNPAYRPTKPTALALALALELDLEQTKDLIGRAGFALTNSSKFDLIIRYFIEQGNYDVMEINAALYEFDQSLLGA